MFVTVIFCFNVKFTEENYSLISTVQKHNLTYYYIKFYINEIVYPNQILK